MPADLNSRGRFMSGGNPVLQWQDDSKQNGYKLKSALITQNTDLTQTMVGVTYLRFMECVKTSHMLYASTTSTFVHGLKINICILLFGSGQKLTFKKYDPGHPQTMEYRICDSLGVANLLLVNIYTTLRTLTKQ